MFRIPKELFELEIMQRENVWNNHSDIGYNSMHIILYRDIILCTLYRNIILCTLYRNMLVHVLSTFMHVYVLPQLNCIINIVIIITYIYIFFFFYFFFFFFFIYTYIYFIFFFFFLFEHVRKLIVTTTIRLLYNLI